MFFAWLVGVGSPANAQTPPPDPDAPEARVAQARELYKLGAGLYKAGRYKEAIAAFEEAYALSGNEKILYNIANAQERLGDLAGAINSLRAYRPYASPSDVVSLDLRIAAIESRMEQIPPLQPAPAPRPEAVVREAPVPTPLPTTSEALPQSRPRWALVGTGAALAVGFGATAVFTYLEGQDRQMASDAGGYRTNRTINNLSVPIASIGGGLALLGFALPQKRNVALTANPTGATLRLTF